MFVRKLFPAAEGISLHCKNYAIFDITSRLVLFMLIYILFQSAVTRGSVLEVQYIFSIKSNNKKSLELK
jgi:hypothetical protein